MPSVSGSPRRNGRWTVWPRQSRSGWPTRAPTEVEVALWRIALDADDGLRLRLVEVLGRDGHP